MPASNSTANLPQDFDYLVVDAFSSDSIPVHLLTKQAALLYGRHLKPTGTLLIHISNHTLDLEPVVNGVAQALGWGARRAENHSPMATRPPTPLPG